VLEISTSNDSYLRIVLVCLLQRYNVTMASIKAGTCSCW